MDPLFLCYAHHTDLKKSPGETRDLTGRGSQGLRRKDLQNPYSMAMVSTGQGASASTWPRTPAGMWVVAK